MRQYVRKATWNQYLTQVVCRPTHYMAFSCETPCNAHSMGVNAILNTLFVTFHTPEETTSGHSHSEWHRPSTDAVSKGASQKRCGLRTV